MINIWDELTLKRLQQSVQADRDEAIRIRKLLKAERLKVLKSDDKDYRTTSEALDDLLDEIMLAKYDRTKNLGKFARETLNP